MCGRSRLVTLCWLACLLAGALCLTAGGLADPRSGQVVTLHHQQTIVTLRLTDAGQLTRCETVEVNFPEEERKALAAIGRERAVTNITLPRMMETLRRCQRLDAVRRRRQPSRLTATPGPRPQADASTLLRGLVPGTKWCGLGDTAKGWNDLGPNAELDRCCRTHDLCPVKVKAYRRRYDLFNWGVYTKSHCACDQEFYRCLKSCSVREADQVGRLFFDFLQPQCVQAGVCAPQEPADVCLERLKAGGAPVGNRLRFFDQPQRYKTIPSLVSDVVGGGGGGGDGDGTSNRTVAALPGDARDVVQIAAVGVQSTPTQASYGASGGLTAFFSRLWSKFG